MIQLLLFIAVGVGISMYVGKRLRDSDGDFRNAEGGYMLNGKDWHGREIQPPKDWPRGWQMVEADDWH